MKGWKNLSDTHTHIQKHTHASACVVLRKHPWESTERCDKFSELQRRIANSYSQRASFEPSATDWKKKQKSDAAPELHGKILGCRCSQLFRFGVVRDEAQRASPIAADSPALPFRFLKTSLPTHLKQCVGFCYFMTILSLHCLSHYWCFRLGFCIKAPY